MKYTDLLTKTNYSVKILISTIRTLYPCRSVDQSISITLKDK